MSEEPTPQPSPKRRAKFAVGGVVVALTLVGLVVLAMAQPGATGFYFTPTELDDRVAVEEVRLNGTVVPGSIEREGLTTSFLVTDGTSEIPVATDAPMPDAFTDRSEVVAIGRFEQGAVTADQVLAKCPSKFKARA